MYDWHVDVGGGVLSTRKISIVIQLDHPTDYEGGDLILKRGAGDEPVFKQKGSVVMFPSYMLHRVTPVTGGLRRTAVLWATGPHFS
jgi:PKHD-type hydroxylase